MAVKIKTGATELFDRIEAGESFSNNTDGNYGSELCQLLSEAGYKPYRTYSQCKVASFESHLQKGSREVDVVVSNFMGVFTQVSAR